MPKQTQINNWDQHHLLLSNEKKKEKMLLVMELCEWSQATFYLKKRNQNDIKQWEKQLIVQAYGVKFTTFFTRQIHKV